MPLVLQANAIKMIRESAKSVGIELEERKGVDTLKWRFAQHQVDQFNGKKSTDWPFIISFYADPTEKKLNRFLDTIASAGEFLATYELGRDLRLAKCLFDELPSLEVLDLVDKSNQQIVVRTVKGQDRGVEVGIVVNGHFVELKTTKVFDMDLEVPGLIELANLLPSGDFKHWPADISTNERYAIEPSFWHAIGFSEDGIRRANILLKHLYFIKIGEGFRLVPMELGGDYAASETILGSRIRTNNLFTKHFILETSAILSSL